jgi:hypothetical protein
MLHPHLSAALVVGMHCGITSAQLLKKMAFSREIYAAQLIRDHLVHLVSKSKKPHRYLNQSYKSNSMPVSKKASGITTMPAETLNYNGEIT